MPGFPVLHYLPDFAQTHVHQVGDAIQPPHPLSDPSPAFSLSQNQGLFQWVSSLNQVYKVLEFQLQHQSFHWIFRVDFLQDWLVGSPCSPKDSKESSLAPHFKSIDSSALSLLYGPALTSVQDYWKNHSFKYTDLCWQRKGESIWLTGANQRDQSHLKMFKMCLSLHGLPKIHHSREKERPESSGERSRKIVLCLLIF